MKLSNVEEGSTKFRTATLNDGTVLEDVYPVRFSGYDTTIWFQGYDHKSPEGELLIVPRDSIMKLEL